MPALLFLLAVVAIRAALLIRQRGALRADTGTRYARALVTQRVSAQLWQCVWALLILGSAGAVSRLSLSLGSIGTLFVIVLAGWFWELPPKAWKLFVLDAHYGFNRLKPLQFAREQALRALMFAALALPAVAIATALVQYAGAGWWLVLWAIGWGGFAAVRWLQPRYVSPLFDPVEPLPDSPLKSRLQALLTRCGVTRQRLFIMRASARSAQANAQVSGSLGSPRIVLHDTLIQQLRPDEVEAVVAHELGHLQRGHLRSQMLMLGTLWLLLIAFLVLLTQTVADTTVRLALAWALLPSAWLLAQPWLNTAYRRFEFEADEAAAQNSSPAAMASALRTLTKQNANAIRNDRWYEWVYHSHPALPARLAKLDRTACISVNRP
jgi:STE24 endopeptidase